MNKRRIVLALATLIVIILAMLVTCDRDASVIPPTDPAPTDNSVARARPAVTDGSDRPAQYIACAKDCYVDTITDTPGQDVAVTNVPVAMLHDGPDATVEMIEAMLIDMPVSLVATIPIMTVTDDRTGWPWHWPDDRQWIIVPPVDDNTSIPAPSVILLTAIGMIIVLMRKGTT